MNNKQAKESHANGKKWHKQKDTTGDFQVSFDAARNYDHLSYLSLTPQLLANFGLIIKWFLCPPLSRMLIDMPLHIHLLSQFRHINLCFIRSLRLRQSDPCKKGHNPAFKARFHLHGTNSPGLGYGLATTPILYSGKPHVPLLYTYGFMTIQTS